MNKIPTKYKNMKIDYYKEDVNLKNNYKNGKISGIKENQKLKNICKSKDKSKNVNFGQSYFSKINNFKHLKIDFKIY